MYPMNLYTRAEAPHFDSNNAGHGCVSQVDFLFEKTANETIAWKTTPVGKRMKTWPTRLRKEWLLKRRERAR
jgi:hypothetical protein